MPGRPRHLLRKSRATLSHSASTVMYSRTPATKSFILYPPVSLVFDMGIRDSFPPVVLICFSPLTACLPHSYANSFMLLERTWAIQGTSLLLHILQYYESISFNVSSASKLSPCLHLWLGNQKTSKGSVSSETLLLWSLPVCKILDMNLFWLVYTTTNNKWQN